VFSFWREDKDLNILRGIAFDTECWKIRFVKSEETQKNIKEIVIANFWLLKTLFIELIANSQYPAITRDDFAKWVSSLGLIDAQFLISDAERLFIACKAGTPPELEKYVLSDRDMNRYEFVESLVRIADQKYVVPKLIEDHGEALKDLML